MKKFTGNFLFGEQSLGHVLRKIGLSMVAILLAVAVYAQAQDTYHVYADDTSFCYQGDNAIYEVDISMKDFVKIDTFTLVLEYDQDVFSYEGYDDLHAVLDGTGTFEIDASVEDKLEITWGSKGDPVGNGTIGATADEQHTKTKVFALQFELVGTPYLYGPADGPYLLETDLTWLVSESEVWNDQEGQVTQILTSDYVIGGGLAVTQSIERDDIELSIGSVDCDGGDALVTVLSPVGEGYTYSFNGNTFREEVSTEVEVQADGDNTHTLVIKNGDYCVSYVKNFTIDDVPDALAYTTDEVVYTECFGGAGDIEIIASGGTPQYTYYIVPDSEWTQEFESNLTTGSKSNANEAVQDYAKANNVLQRYPGTYHVAVQDANECQDLRDLTWWTTVEVEDNNTEWDVSIPVNDVTCNGGANGTATISIAGGTPFEDGYNVYVGTDYYRGGAGEDAIVLDGLTAGTYSVQVVDAKGCSYETEFVIDEPQEIDFWVEHTDASCGDGDTPPTNGTMAIDTATIEGGNTTADFAGWTWQYSTSPDFTAETTVDVGSVNDTAFNLEPAVYYVRLYDSEGCPSVFTNPNGDNAVKVMTTEFDLVVDGIACNGGYTDVSIELTTGSGNHDFMYNINGGDWQESNVFTNLQAGTYEFRVWDTTIDCILLITEPITEPDPLVAEIVDQATLPPTCPGNTDGNVTIRVSGGTPLEDGGYWYEFDNDGRYDGSEIHSFAIDTAQHTITIEDANGCTEEIMVDWPNSENRIEFVDTIYNECALGEINLFNRYGEECEPVPFDLFEVYDIPVDTNLNEVSFNIEDIPEEFQFDNNTMVINGITVEVDVSMLEDIGTLYEFAELLNDLINSMTEGYEFDFWYPGYYICSGEQTDFGYMEYFEWYGIPVEQFSGTVTYDIQVWTSADGWVTRTLQGVQQFRDPVLYITDTDPNGNAQTVVDNGEQVGQNSSFSAGTYWVVAMDEWGCASNIEEIVILDPPSLEVEWSTVDAGCYGTTTGEIRLEAFNGTNPIPNYTSEGARYEYVLTQQPQIFNKENWEGEVQWNVFSGGEGSENDSVMVKAVQAGTYYMAVRAWCGVANTDLIEYVGPIVVESAPEIEVDMEAVTIVDIDCNIRDDENYPASDGAILGLEAATTGGFGDYVYSLSKVEEGETTTITEVETGNTTGDFTDLYAGTYILTVESDTLNGCAVQYEIEITEPDPFWVEIDVVNASCNEVHDGLIVYKIHGGTPPYKESTNNVGDGSFNWYDLDGKTREAHDFEAFNRRVRAGTYVIWVEDANGCPIGPDTVVVDQPDKLEVTEVDTNPVSCNTDVYSGVTDNGSISFMPKGGWNKAEDGFMYTARIQGESESAVTFDVLPDEDNPIVWNDLPAGEYTIELFEHNSSLVDGEYWENPINTYTDYFDRYHDWAGWDYQNPNTSSCNATGDAVIEEPAAITYGEIEWRDVKCHNTPTGEIYVPNITGGTPDSEDGYYVGLEGPGTVGQEGEGEYDPELQSNYDTRLANEVTDGDIVWFHTNGENEFTFDGLTWGHYTVHIQDGEGCWIYEESGQIFNPDTLEIDVVEKLTDATCFDGFGQIEIHALGGQPPYEYAVNNLLTPDPGYYNFPYEDEASYLETLEWQDEAVFDVPAATWIGYVRDANGCVVGYATTETGSPIFQHRVNVRQPDEIVPVEYDQNMATCYESADGEITIEQISGGVTQPWWIHVTGTDYEGNEVDTVYNVHSSESLVLGGLRASTNEMDPADMTADDLYTFVVYEDQGMTCPSDEYQQYVLHPEPFRISVTAEQDAFICPDDKAGIYQIEVISGGTPFAGDNYEFMWEAYTDSTMSTQIDSLTGDWGFAETYLGYGDIYYKVYARDAEGCETDTSAFVKAPEPIEFDVQRINCYGDEMGSARITASGTEGRSFQVLYRVTEDETGILSPKPDWTVYNGWFTETIDIMDEFVFDDDILTDYRYEFVVEDTFGCRSDVMVVTFDPVQHPLELDVRMVSESECTSEVEVIVNGGIPPYEIVMNNDSVISEGIYSLPAGTYDFRVTDAHLICEDMVTVDVAATPVVRDTMIEVYIGEDTTFVDAEAGVDTTLTEGTYTFSYMFEGCERTLNVEAVGVPRVVDIITVQGETEESPWIGAVVEVTGTVSGIAQSEGFFMQDANAPWSGIWVAYSETAMLEVGNGVTVVGEVAEVADVTTIQATEMTIVTPPLTVEPLIVEPMEAENEMYESVLVQVEGARANAADEDTGEWTIFTETGNDVVVNDWLFVYVPEEGHFYDVTGVVNGRLDAFKLEPRMESDVVDLTATPANLISESIRFTVYPNPFNDHIKIDNNDKLTRVVISNIAGQRVMDVEYPSHEIRTANLVSGVYVVSMFTEDGLAKTERIVKR